MNSKISIIALGVILGMGFVASDIYADVSEDKLQAQINVMQKQLDELKAQREQDKKDIKSLKAERGGESEGYLSDVVVTGYFTWEYRDRENQNSTFDNYFFNPIFLWQANDNLLLEAELEYEHGGDEIELEYADIYYILNDYITLGAGKFLVPFGVFNDRLHPSWINKVAGGLGGSGRPLSHNYIVPVAFSDVGIQVRGGVPITDEAKLDYALYVTNGLEGAEGTAVRDLRDENGRDNNNNRAVGGRLGVRLPRFEAGVSGYNGAYTPDGQQDYTMLGIDGAFWWTPLFELRGEWVTAKEEMSTVNDLDKDGWYFQAAYKLADVPVQYLNQCELVARYSTIDTEVFSGGAVSDFDRSTTTLGINYYIKESFIARLAYDWNKEDSGSNTNNDQLTAQITWGF